MNQYIYKWMDGWIAESMNENTRIDEWLPDEWKHSAAICWQFSPAIVD